MTLNMFCDQLKNTAIAALNEAHSKAVEDLKDIDAYNFDFMILQSSYKEGESEANTLVRVFQIFQRDALWESLRNPENSRAFNDIVKTIRPIGEIKIPVENSPDDPVIFNVRRRELYERDPLIIHTPLQLGDIFKIEGENSSEYILLAQPCDLMIRNDGERARTDPTVPLVPVEDTISPKQAKKKRHDDWKACAPMPYFEQGSNRIAVLSFKKARWVNVSMLDLAVLDNQGRCYLDTNREYQIPTQLTSGWQTRLKIVIDEFKEMKNYLDKLVECLEDDIDRQLWQLMLRVSLSDIGISPQPYSESVFDFGLKRIGRFRRPGADGLLKSFTQYLSRDAGEHDFAQAR